MARAGGWSTRKTTWVTFLAGLGHVGSSVLLGMIGIALGTVVSQLEEIEASRGRAAGWLLTAFGLGYLLWGIYYSLKGTRAPHVHLQKSVMMHDHDNDTRSHSHPSESPMPESATQTSARLTPWILFTIFIFGPCEPLIPLLMYPAAESSWSGVVLVGTLFSITTVATMLGVVLILLKGAEVVRVSAFQRFSHAFAGMLMMICGIAINFGL